ncbi:LCP family protein [Candidatus Saccharibacteria bacterium]|nr:LCP family protein [Candidatus Saccharibacteria bacterium]
MFSLNIIDGGLLILLSFAFAALLGLSIIKLLLKNNTARSTKFICSAVSIITIIAALFALRYTGSFNSFLDNITDQSAETKEYSVLVLKNHSATKIADLKNQTIGFLKNDPDSEKAIAQLKNTIDYRADLSDSIDDLTAALTSATIPAIALETSRYNALVDDEFPVAKITKIIYRFEITLNSVIVDQAEVDPIAQPFTVYISGIDSRTGLQSVALSDVNILAIFNPKDHKILLVSIPRDTYVQLHGTTGLKDKLTHAGIYGISMSKSTVEDFLDIKIDHTAKVSFETVIKVVNQLNGIEINSDQAMSLKTGEGSSDKNRICTYIVGIQQVDGDCALRFARERKSYATGDRHRGENQQQVLASIINKLAADKSYLLKLPEILDIVASSFETSFSRDEISNLIRYQLSNNQAWQIESISIDGSGSMQPTYSMGANTPLYVMLPYPESISVAQEKIKSYLFTPVDN